MTNTEGDGGDGVGGVGVEEKSELEGHNLGAGS